MPDRYFDKFQTIRYANNIAVNITERAAILNKTFNNPYVFYPYDVSENERPDQISDKYYNDQYKSWMIYFSNQIVDPYYQWYMSDTEFNNYLFAKYNADIFTLQDKVQFYRNNWYDNETPISVSTYYAMANTLHRYWEPVYNGSGAIIGYSRTKDDLVINTNFIVNITLASAQTFTNNEIVTINFDGSHIGRGQVLHTGNSTSLSLQHMFGSFVTNSDVVITGSSYVYGTESQANVIFTGITTVANNLSLDDIPYFSAVSIYDYEREQNEQNKSIKLLDSRFSAQAASELKSLLG